MGRPRPPGHLTVADLSVDAGTYQIGKISTGDTDPFETFNGNVNGCSLTSARPRRPTSRHNCLDQVV